MKPEQLRSEINRLSIEEKLQLVGDIWDSIAHENAPLPLTDAQRKILDERYHAYKAGELQLEDWSSVREELRSLYK